MHRAVRTSQRNLAWRSLVLRAATGLVTVVAARANATPGFVVMSVLRDALRRLSQRTKRLSFRADDADDVLRGRMVPMQRDDARHGGEARMTGHQIQCETP